jgi:hypothetical protein
MNDTASRARNTDILSSRLREFLFYSYREMLEVTSRFGPSQQRQRPIFTMCYDMIPQQSVLELGTSISLLSTSTKILPPSMDKQC